MTEDTDADDGQEPTTARPDGGTDADADAVGADEVALDPWGSSTVSNYRSLFESFGIEEFEAVLEEVPDPHYLMRRGVIFGHRDYRPVARAMREGEPFAALSGFMPTGDPHIGHKLVFDELVWHQQQGGDTYGLIADLEAHSARGMSWAEIDEHARDYLLSLLALGFDPEAGTLYRQSENRRLQDLAFELGSKANFSEFEAIYGFDGETNVSHMQSVVTQMADILYPQLDGPKPTVIPVGPDQDPHMRFARDLASRMRFFKVTEAYASFELTDAEREIVGWIYHSIEDAIESGLGMETIRVDAEDADFGNITCEQARHFLNEVRSVPLSEEVIDEFNLSPEELADAGHDFSPEEWDQILSALEPFDVRPYREAPDESIQSLRRKLESGGQEPLQRRTRFLDRNATDAAFEALVEAVDGEKRVYEGHVDAFELSREAAEELAREVELDHGGFGFVAPSSIYHRFMTGLTGGKMSSSVPASHISLLDAPEEGYEKVKAATTGGRETAAKQRELGGEPDDCPVYELYAYLLAADDDEFAKRVYEECADGERLCGDCKEQAARLMEEFLRDHQEKRAEAEELLADLDIDVETDRRGVGGEE